MDWYKHYKAYRAMIVLLVAQCVLISVVNSQSIDNCTMRDITDAALCLATFSATFNNSSPGSEFTLDACLNYVAVQQAALQNLSDCYDDLSQLECRLFYINSIDSFQRNIEDSANSCNIFSDETLPVVDCDDLPGNTVLMEVFYSMCPSNEILACDQELQPATCLMNTPIVKFPDDYNLSTGDTFFIAMVDFDAGAQNELYIHWIEQNIDGSQLDQMNMDMDMNIPVTGLPIITYEQPNPPTGTHHYQIFVIEQFSIIATNESSRFQRSMTLDAFEDLIYALDNSSILGTVQGVFQFRVASSTPVCEGQSLTLARTCFERYNETMDSLEDARPTTPESCQFYINQQRLSQMALQNCFNTIGDTACEDVLDGFMNSINTNNNLVRSTCNDTTNAVHSCNIDSYLSAQDCIFQYEDRTSSSSHFIPNSCSLYVEQQQPALESLQTCVALITDCTHYINSIVHPIEVKIEFATIFCANYTEDSILVDLTQPECDEEFNNSVVTYGTCEWDTSLVCGQKLNFSTCLLRKPLVKLPADQIIGRNYFIFMVDFGVDDKDKFDIAWIEQNIPVSHFDLETNAALNGTPIIAYNLPHPWFGVHDYYIHILEQVKDIPTSVYPFFQQLTNITEYSQFFDTLYALSYFDSNIGSFQFKINGDLESEPGAPPVTNTTAPPTSSPNELDLTRVDCSVENLLTVSYPECGPLVCGDLIAVNCTYVEPTVSVDERFLSDAQQYILIVVDSDFRYRLANNTVSNAYSLHWTVINIPRASVINGSLTGGEDATAYIQPNPQDPALAESSAPFDPTGGVHHYEFYLFEQETPNVSVLDASRLFLSSTFEYNKQLQINTFEDSGYFSRRVATFVYRQGPLNRLTDGPYVPGAGTTTASSAGERAGQEDDDDDDESSLNYLYWLIPVIVVAALLVFALVVVAISKLQGKGKQDQTPEYSDSKRDSTASEAETDEQKRRDSTGSDTQTSDVNTQSASDSKASNGDMLTLATVTSGVTGATRGLEVTDVGVSFASTGTSVDVAGTTGIDTNSYIYA